VVPLTPSTLKTAVERWEVEVDVCVHSCGGVWIDKADFQVDPKASLLLNRALLAYNVPALKGLLPESQAECPVCVVPMAPYRWKQTDVPLDRCGQCGGLWFDGHEIDSVQRQLQARPQAPRPTAASTSAGASSAEQAMRRRVVMGAVVAIAMVAVVALGLKGGFFAPDKAPAAKPAKASIEQGTPRA
jgi:Zn-finger nucleic acid-binding protein